MNECRPTVNDCFQPGEDYWMLAPRGSDLTECIPKDQTICLLQSLFDTVLLNVLYCVVFIHFYSASNRASLSEALLTIAIDTVSEEFTRLSATGNCK